MMTILRFLSLAFLGFVIQFCWAFLLFISLGSPSREADVWDIIFFGLVFILPPGLIIFWQLKNLASKVHLGLSVRWLQFGFIFGWVAAIVVLVTVFAFK